MKSIAFTVTDPAGLHARPAADLARHAATCSSDVRVKRRGGRREADAKSMLAIMALGIRAGDVVVLCVEGRGEERDASGLRAFCEAEL